MSHSVSHSFFLGSQLAAGDLEVFLLCVNVNVFHREKVFPAAHGLKRFIIYARTVSAGGEGVSEAILTNEKYKGDALLQKTYCTDFLTKKMKTNEGEVPQYYVKDSHPAIVDADVFDLVQMEFARRKALKGQYSGNGCFASRIVCGDCGHFYSSKVWHGNDPYRKVLWRCNHKYDGQKYAIRTFR